MARNLPKQMNGKRGIQVPEFLFSKDAEDALVSYVLVNPDEYHGISIEPVEFYFSVPRLIYQAIGHILKTGGQPDYISVMDCLDARGHLEDIGGAAELSRLINCYQFGFQADEAVRIIRDFSQRRSLLTLASDIARAAQDRKVELGDASAEFIDRMSRLSSCKSGAVQWSIYFDALFGEIQERMETPRDTWGIPTGFHSFDRITGGLQPGEEFILSGKPGVGKSMLAMDMAARMAQQAPGAIYSLEMTGRQVVRRITSSRAEVQSNKLKTGRISDAEYPKVTKAIDALQGLPVYMSDAANMTTGSIRSDLARLKAQHDIQWFVFDYLLLAGDAPEKEEIERTAMISRQMKIICRHLEVAGIVIHSMNKAGMDKSRPEQSNLRGSAQVSFDADLICFLNEFTPMSPQDGFIAPAEQANMRTLFFAKGRELENPEKYLHLVKLPGYPTFGDYETERMPLGKIK
jgi:replicative DNA helicase